VKTLPDYVTKYLNKFASNKWQIGTNLNRDFEMIVVIPAIDEFSNIKKLVKSILNNDSRYFDKTLIMFVVNNGVHSSIEIKEANKKSLQYISKIADRKDGDEALFNINKNTKLTFSFVDASTSGNELPSKEAGVGLARKIGMDLALNYFCYEHPKQTLVCLDADCEVSDNYISMLYEKIHQNKIDAASIKFEHQLNNSEEINKAIINYEIFLRFYVLGLKYANSPYSFFTIGSSMACSVQAYCNIGGMNKKKAAEDFYFMEKLSKNYLIKNINNCAVYPSSRGSWRVPFGTGQRVNRFLSNTQNDYLLYNPVSFSILKEWLSFFTNSESQSALSYLVGADKIYSGLKGFLESQNFVADWTRIMLNTKTSEQLIKQKSFWFDGFRTLKLVHYLRDHSLGLSPMFNALDELFALIGVNAPSEREIAVPAEREQIKYLQLLREITN
jgi:uncharacterized protein YjaG (DUF416 family)